MIFLIFGKTRFRIYLIWCMTKLLTHNTKWKSWNSLFRPWLRLIRSLLREATQKTNMKSNYVAESKMVSELMVYRQLSKAWTKLYSKITRNLIMIQLKMYSTFLRSWSTGMSFSSLRVSYRAVWLYCNLKIWRKRSKMVPLTAFKPWSQRAWNLLRKSILWVN